MINKKNIANQIIDSITEMILNKTIIIGDRLPTELDLAEQLGVGRSSVREALKGLEAINVISRKKDGTYVAIPDDDFLYNQLILLASLKNISKKELSEARNILEFHIAQLAAKRAQQHNLEELQYWATKSDAGKISENIKINLNFHLAIANATQNIALVELVKSLKNAIIKSRFLSDGPLSDDKIYTQAKSEHVGIYKAIFDGDSELAGMLMKKHLKGLYPS